MLNASSTSSDAGATPRLEASTLDYPGAITFAAALRAAPDPRYIFETLVDDLEIESSGTYPRYEVATQLSQASGAGLSSFSSATLPKGDLGDWFNVVYAPNVTGEPPAFEATPWGGVLQVVMRSDPPPAFSATKRAQFCSAVDAEERFTTAYTVEDVNWPIPDPEDPESVVASPPFLWHPSFPLDARGDGVLRSAPAGSDVIVTRSVASPGGVVGQFARLVVSLPPVGGGVFLSDQASGLAGVLLQGADATPDQMLFHPETVKWTTLPVGTVAPLTPDPLSLSGSEPDTSQAEAYRYSYSAWAQLPSYRYFRVLVAREACRVVGIGVAWEVPFITPPLPITVHLEYSL
jgi:hypothetical protein